MKTISPARRIASTLLMAFCLVFIPTAIEAQTSTFTYQGRFSDTSVAQQPTNGTYDFQFALYDAVTAGTLIASNATTTTSVSVVNGVFNAPLDFGSAAFSGANRFLEIRVKKPGETTYTPLAPRQAITSTPYAIRALNATNVDATGGNSVVNSINNAATTAPISSSRLAADVVRLNPGATQTATTTDSSAALLDATGTTTDTNNNVLGTSRFRVNFNGGFFVSGQQNVGTVPTTGAGARMMFYPGKFAFRAGRVYDFGSAYWDEANIGTGSVALGENTRATGSNSFAANLATTASGSESVALGNNAAASADRSFTFNGTASGVGAVAIGSGAQATNDDALALGPSSIAGGLGSVTIGPSIANGSFAVAIGLQNRAYGNFSLALGKNAVTCSNYYNCAATARQGAIVISDGCAGFSSDAVTASANNQVNIRGCGGFRFFTGQTTPENGAGGQISGVSLAPGGSQWLSLSDRNSKENFLAVDKRDILRKVLKLPITTWNYKAQGASIRHIGAMAQDFKAAFEIGEDDKHISSLDPDGVAFAAIQGLNEELNERTAKLTRENNQLKEQLAAQNQINAEQNQTIAAFEARLKRLEQAAVKPRRRVAGRNR